MKINDVLLEFAPGNGDDNGGEDSLFRFAKMWYSAPDVATQRRAEQALAKIGWEIGELESEEGGAFVMRIGDDNGDSYIGWSEEDLAGLDESGMLGFLIPSNPTVRKSASLSDMRKEFEKEPNTPLPNIEQNKDADEKTASVVHRKHADEGMAEGNDPYEPEAHDEFASDTYYDDEQGVAEGNKKPEQPEADYGDDYQAMVSRVKKLAGLGPLKTVYNPQKRVYKNVPTAEQPKK
jgi:hypothetical protein